MPKKTKKELNLLKFNVASRTRVTNHAILILTEIVGQPKYDGVLLRSRGMANPVALNVANRVIRISKGQLMKNPLIILTDEEAPDKEDPNRTIYVSALEITILRAAPLDT